LNELALFAGSGGGILGGHLLGWRTVAAVEIEDYPRRVLLQRQADGLLPRFPVWDDICTFDGHPWQGKVDVISGGFPCQDISAAGKGDGLDGERSGLWTHMARVVSEVRPSFVFVENSPMLTTRGGTRVIADLTQMGYDTKWAVMGAADVGAPHQRDRMWIVGKMGNSHNNGQIATKIGASSIERSNSYKVRQEQTSQPKGSSQQHDELAYTQQQGLERWSNSRQQEIAWAGGGGALAYTKDKRNVWREWELGFAEQEHNRGRSSINGSRQWWSVEPNLGRVANGVAHRVDRLKAIGNGQVPLCAATAWRILSE
jgi:DNA (cytosine-5)-methyltransferase 1